MIENLECVADGVMKGTFESCIFKNEDGDELSVGLQSESIVEYAEKCIEHFNSMQDSMIDEICKYIIKSSENGGLAEDFELPELENARDILKYCWFTTMYIDIPQTDEVAYMVEGEGDWGECVGFIVRGDRVLYVGSDFYHSPWENDEYYENLDDNCVY